LSLHLIDWQWFVLFKRWDLRCLFQCV